MIFAEHGARIRAGWHSRRARSGGRRHRRRIQLHAAAVRPGSGAGEDDGLLNIDAIAENYWHIHRQPRSAWTQELDLRPFKETF